MGGPKGGKAMNDLLFDERPLVIQPTLAKLLGSLDEAAILQQIHYWLVRSANIKDGHKWVYNSMTEWHKQFFWIPIATLKRKFKSLETKGLLITGNYNKAKFDKTKWYRIDYDALYEMKQRLYQNDTTRESNCTNGECQNDTTRESSCANGEYQNDTTNTIDYQENTTIDYQENTAEAEQEAAATAEGQARDLNEVFNEETNAQIEALADVESCYQVNLRPKGGIPYQIKTDMAAYVDQMGPSLVKHAIEKSVIQVSNPSWGYIKAILNGWLKTNVKTIEAAKKADEDYQQRKAQQQNRFKGGRRIVQKESLPDWAQPDYQEPEQAEDPEKAKQIAEMMAKINARRKAQ